MTRESTKVIYGVNTITSVSFPWGNWLQKAFINTSRYEKCIFPRWWVAKISFCMCISTSKDDQHFESSSKY